MASESDGMGGYISFMLDDHGDVWGEVNPVNANPGILYKLKGLHDIVSLAPLGAVRRDGKVFTWNLNLKSGDSYTKAGGGFTEPKMVEGIDHAVAIDSGFHGFLVLLADGTLVQWRESFLPYFPEHHSPEPVPGVSGIIQMSGRESGGVVLTRDGKVVVWRHNYLIERSAIYNPLSTQTQILYDGGDAKQVLLLRSLIVVLKTDGHVLYWDWGNARTSSDSKSKMSGYVDEIDDVVGLYRNGDEDVFYARRDGSVWWVMPPDPVHPLPPPPYLENYDPHKDRLGLEVRACKLKGITVPVISAAGAPVMLVGSDHSLWEGGCDGVHKIDWSE